MKLSLILAVHNEALFLPYLDVVLNYVDEAIIVDSSPFGQSDDGSTEILEDYAMRYPFVILSKGIYRRNDGIRDCAWDEETANNLMISQASGDFLLFHHADIIYDVVDLEKIRKAIDTFSNKLIFYTDYLEFIWDTYHLHLHQDSLIESAFFKPLTGYAFVVSRMANPSWRNYPLGLQLEHGVDMTTALFCPHIRRWHFAHCKPYPLEVAHVCRQIATGDMKGLENGVEACINLAITGTESLRGQGFDYCGDYPEIMQNWCPSCEDGRDEFYQNINFYRSKLSKYFY